MEALWRSIQNDGFEHVRVNGTIVDGVVVRRSEDATFRSRYRIERDDGWRVLRVVIDSLDDDRRLELRRSGNEWTNEEGVPIDTLRGCTDLDLRASPFTNTLAINRLRLSAGESRDIDVVFLDPGTLRYEHNAQRYTRLNANTYRYLSLDSGFTADLPTDEHGLLIEYPGWFERVW